MSFRFLSFVVFASFASTVGAQLAAELTAESAWESLSKLSLAARPAEISPRIETDTYLTSVIAEARAFRARFPDHPLARSASAVELTARINSENDLTALAPDTADAVEAYVADHANAVRDRIRVRVAVQQAALQRQRHTTYLGRLEAQSAQASELMREFPDEIDGYGFKLALARLAPPQAAIRLADELLSNPKTPGGLEEMARRVRDRTSLLGRPFRASGTEQIVSNAGGRPLVVYSWRTSDEGFIAILQKLRSLPGVVFIGVNLDVDSTHAHQIGASLPGTQIFDGNGLNGPLARDLKLVLATSIYLVDPEGILRDIDAHRSPLLQVAEFVKGGGR